MNAHKKFLIKQALRIAKYLKSKEKGKRTKLTNEEIEAVRQGKIKFMGAEKPKENFKPLTKEPIKIGDILKWKN